MGEGGGGRGCGVSLGCVGIAACGGVVLESRPGVCRLTHVVKDSGDLVIGLGGVRGDGGREATGVLPSLGALVVHRGNDGPER